MNTGTSENMSLSRDNMTLWTSLTPKERERSVRWFASRPVEEQAAILLDVEETTFPRLRQANPENAQDGHLRYAAFVLAVRRAGFDLLRKRGYRVHGHKNYDKFEELRQGTLQSLRDKKKAPLRQEVLSLWGEVCRLKMSGTGFLLISRYLWRAHQLKVSPSYIAKLWKSLEGQWNTANFPSA